MEYPFEPNQFQDYAEYENHSTQLSRAQAIARKICGAWGDEYGLAEPFSPWQEKLFELINMATQIGYEQAINKKHSSSDYGMTPDFVECLPNKCEFCNNQYFAYGCEERCANEEKDEKCRLEVKNFID